MDKTHLEKLLQGVLTLAIVFILAPGFFFVVALTLPFRCIVSLLAKYKRPDLDGFVAGMSGSFASYPSMNLVFFLFIDGQVTLERGRTLFQENIFSLKTPKGELLYKKFRQTFTKFVGYNFWEQDINFKLENHVREYDYDGEGFELKKGFKKEEVSKIVSGLLGVPWKRGQSPWEGFFLEMASSAEVANGRGRTMFIFRHHHVLADGFSMAEFFKNLGQADLTLPKPKAAFSNQLTPWSVLKIPYDFAGILMDSWDFESSWHFQVLTKEFFCSKFQSLPVSLIKEAKDKFGVSYAAVLFSVVGGGIQRIVEEANLPVPEFLTTYVPFPRRNHPGGLTNHLNMCVFKWPIKAVTMLERIEKTQKKFSHLSSSFVTGLLYIGPETIGLLPSLIQKLLANAQVCGGSVLATSFPVNEGKTYFDLNPVESLYTAFGTPGNSVGTSILMGGINGEQGIVLTMDRRIFPSEEVFARFGDYIQEELNQMLAI